MTYVKLTTLILGICSILFFSICFWLVITFDKVSFEQLLWHIANLPSLAYLDIDYKLKTVKNISATALIILVFIFITIYIDKIFLLTKNFISKNKIYSIDRNTNLKLNYALLCLSCVSFAISIFYVQSNIDFMSSIKSADYKFIESNYRVPDKSQISIEKPKNLVIILAESLENSFSSPNLKDSYIKELAEWRDKNQYNSNMREVSGTNWTIAALTAWSFGLPLKIPANLHKNYYISKRGFLPNSTSIFDILYQHGYKLVVLMGTDKRFSGQDILFSGHGDFTIYDKNHFEKSGWVLKKYSGGFGFSDKFILDRAFEEYQRLSQKAEPFILLIQTMDTHIPDGFCPENDKKYHDIRDAVIHLDTNVNNFLESIEREREREREREKI